MQSTNGQTCSKVFCVSPRGRSVASQAVAVKVRDKFKFERRRQEASSASTVTTTHVLFRNSDFLRRRQVDSVALAIRFLSTSSHRWQSVVEESVTRVSEVPAADATAAAEGYFWIGSAQLSKLGSPSTTKQMSFASVQIDHPMSQIQNLQTLFSKLTRTRAVWKLVGSSNHKTPPTIIFP